MELLDIKACPGCVKLLPISDFDLLLKSKTWRRTKCKRCTLVDRKVWYSQNRDRQNRKRRARMSDNPELRDAKNIAGRRYQSKDSVKSRRRTRDSMARKGSIEWCIKRSLEVSRASAKKKGHAPCVSSVDEIASAFNGKCRICELIPGEGEHRLVIDHDHETGLFRGWICRHCNTMLGMAKDSPGTLRLAAEYLENIPGSLRIVG